MRHRTILPGEQASTSRRLRLVVAPLVLLALAAGVWGVVHAAGAGADRAVFQDVSLAEWPIDQSGSSEVSWGTPDVLTQHDAPSSAAFAALLTPALPDGAVLLQHSHLSSPDGLQLDEAWYQLPDGAVLLVSRNCVGPDYSVPIDALLMGRPGGVEHWEGGIPAIVSSAPDFVEIKAALDDWIITLVAQRGPVWFGEGEPPPGFFQEGRQGVVPEIAELRSLAQQIIRTEGVLHTP